MQPFNDDESMQTADNIREQDDVRRHSTCETAEELCLCSNQDELESERVLILNQIVKTVADR